MQALQCLVSALRSLVEWFMLCTPVAVANDTPSAPDSSLRPDWGKLTSSTGQGAAEEAEGQPEGEVDIPMPGGSMSITFTKQADSICSKHSMCPVDNRHPYSISTSGCC